MTVDYIFRDGEKRIAGGAEPHYPTHDLSWLDFNGKEVMIRTMNDDFRLNMIRTGDKVFKMS